MAKIVIALGGNALGNNPIEQREIVKKTAISIVDLVSVKHKVIICHGNGPQVGMINLSFDEANKNNKNVPLMPFPECGSMSQGYIAYHLQQAIKNELEKRKLKNDVVGLITQTIVDEKDNAFKNPSKPVGSFYKEEEAKKIAKENKWIIVEDAGRGWRRVVASPIPIDIVEKNVIKNLVDNNVIIIACGGGGIPVARSSKGYAGKDAVIDKDFASAKLAEILAADKLVILTAVDKVMINYNKPEQKALDKITIKECNEYINDNQFAPGSMLPKIKAAMMFVEKNPNKESIIASLKNAKDAILGKSGTKIVK